MYRTVKFFALIVVFVLMVGCAQAAPTTVPTKAPAPTAPTVVTAPTVAPAAGAAAPTAAPQSAAAPAKPAQKIKRGGTIIHARQTDMDTWDPAIPRFGMQIIQLPVYESLVRYVLKDEKTGQGDYEGDLAESWDIVDPKTVVFKLQKGVKFHDGTAFDAAAAKWSIDRAMTHPKAAGAPFFSIIKSVEVVNPQALKVNLHNPTPLLLISLSRIGGGPAALWSGMVSKAAVEKYGDDFGTHPVGTGPVMMVEWLRDNKTTLKKWDGYWRKGVDGQSLPHYDGITARVIPDAASLFSELQAGTLDVTDNIAMQNWSVARRNPNLEVRLNTWAPRVYVIGINQSKLPFADNVKLRQAALYALDRKTIASASSFGESSLPSYYVGWVPTFPGWDETLPKYDYDLAKAKSLVKEAGFADGVDFQFTVQPRYQKLGEIVQQQWAQAGLRAKIDLIDEAASRGMIQQGNFNVNMWDMRFKPDPAYNEASLLCKGSGNHSRYCNEELDKCLPQDRLHPAFNALDQQLASRGSGAKGQDGKGFRLKLANSLWGQSGYQFLPQYLETLARNYGAGLRLADFAQAPEPARLAINDWVSTETEGKIPDLLPQGTVDRLTRLVLVNAVYFNAAWKYPFIKEGTRERPFTLLDGRQIDVPMMTQTKTLAYARGEGYQVVELPYDGDELSLVVLLPDSGAFEQFEGSLSRDRMEAALKGLHPRPVALTLPKFTYESSFSLAETLAGLGMPDAVAPGQADFSGMDGSRDLYITDVIHKAIVVVDERGTEAAAATGVVVGVTSAPAQQPVTLNIDRPFVFLIRDVKTGTVLFIGRVLNPIG